MKPCPLCGSPMTCGVGNIEVPYGSHGKIVRRIIVGLFWACWTCEHCEEAR